MLNTSYKLRSNLDWTSELVQLCRYKKNGRVWPKFDCIGLHRYIRGTRSGVWMPTYEEVISEYAIVRKYIAESKSKRWRQIGFVEDGKLCLEEEDRELDVVFMHGLLERGRFTRAVPLHVGTVIAPGLMIDIEETNDSLIRYYRDTKFNKAHPKVRARVLGVYRYNA